MSRSPISARSRSIRRRRRSPSARPETRRGFRFQRATGPSPIARRRAFPGTPDPSKICVKSGFDPTFLYELVFTAKDPLVLGIGFAATRDLNSFLRYADKDDAGDGESGGEADPWAITPGSSQSGNFIRSFIHLGFNQDEAGRIVWDGANPHIAGRQLALNFRFAVAGGAANLYEPGSEAVLWWSELPGRDAPAAGGRHARPLHRHQDLPENHRDVRRAGILVPARCRPNLVGTDAKADIPLPANVRRYFFPGTSHGGGAGRLRAPRPAPPDGCVLPANPNPETETLKALTVGPGRLGDEGNGAAAEPLSAARSRRTGARRRKAAMGFPTIPGAPSPEGLINLLADYDFGPEFHYNDLSGVITKEPPRDQADSFRRWSRRWMPMAPMSAAFRRSCGRRRSARTSGWNVTAAGFDKGPAMHAKRRIHPVRQDESRAAGGGRPAAVARRALRQPRGLCGGGKSGGGEGGERTIPACGTTRIS